MKNTLPIIRLENLMDELAFLGIVKKKILSVSSVDKFDRTNLSEKQIGQFKYAPVPEILLVEGNDDLWFRSKGSNWASVFVLLPNDLVLLTAEYVTGADIIVIAHCAGVPTKGETLADCGRRETEEESGVVLKSIFPLSTDGLPVSSRKSTERVYPFVGIPKLDEKGEVITVPTRHDDNEEILAFLMPLADYWAFINRDRYNNSIAGRDCAYAALRYLNRLQLK